MLWQGIAFFAGLLFIGILRLRHRIKTFNRGYFGTETLREGLIKEKLERANKPYGLHNMEPVILPLLFKDFPGLNVDEIKTKAERILSAALTAIVEEEVSLFDEVSEEIKEKVQHEITQNQRRGEKKFLSRFSVHRSVLSQYERGAGRCLLTIQVACEGIEYVMHEERILSGYQDRKTQAVYNVYALFVQDESKIKKVSHSHNAYSISCPNCGAPIVNLGYKYCAYCNSPVEEIQMKVWKIVDYKREK